MTTTALIVELLVVGIPATVILLMGVDLFVDGNFFAQVYKQIHEGAASNAVLLLAVSYGVGIVVDRISALIIPINRTSKVILGLPRIGARIKKAFSSALTDPRIKAYKEDGRLSEYLEFTLARVRIIRGHFFCLCILFLIVLYCQIVSKPLFTYPSPIHPLQSQGIVSSWLWVFFSLLCCLIAGSVTVVLMLSYEDFCTQAQKLLEK